MDESKSGHGLKIFVSVFVMLALAVTLLLFGAVFTAAACENGDGDQEDSPSSTSGSVNNSSYKAPEHSDDPVAEKMASFMEGIALDDSHGYSQPRRMGNPDFDCSSAVFRSGQAAGLPLSGYPFTTWNEGPALQRVGFQHFTWSGNYRDAKAKLKRGDVVVNPQEHTEVYVGGGLFAAARHAYPSGVDDGHPGDQGKGDDQEIIISGYLDPGLTDVYRHDPSAQVTASGDATTPGAATPAVCRPADQPDGGDAGDGLNASADQAKAIAKRMIPDYFPGADTEKEYGCLVSMWTRESGWNIHAENASSGAYGIPQALPASKMASVGPDWKDNATTQIKWGLQYIKGRYSTPCGAWSRWQAKGWY